MILLLNSAASLQILLCKGYFPHNLVIIVSNPRKGGIQFTALQDLEVREQDLWSKEAAAEGLNVH